MKRRFFPVQIEKGEISYGAWFVDFPGCVSAGDTIAEAIEGAHEALALHTSGMIRDGEQIPEPSPRTRITRSMTVSRSCELADEKPSLPCCVQSRVNVISYVSPTRGRPLGC